MTAAERHQAASRLSIKMFTLLLRLRLRRPWSYVYTTMLAGFVRRQLYDGPDDE